MIVVQSTFHLLPDCKDEALELMRNMVRLCQQEHGCLAYEYFEGVSDPCHVVLLQEWENAECLQEHYQTDHMADFLGNLGRFLESPVSTRSYISEEESAIAAQSIDAAEDFDQADQTIH